MICSKVKCFLNVRLMDAKIKVFFVLTKCLIKNISKQSFVIRHAVYYQ